MEMITSAVTGFSEAIFSMLVAHPILILVTAALSVAIWILPNRLLKESAQRHGTKG